MSNNSERNRRNEAFEFEVNGELTNRIVLEDGLYIITKEQILRIRTSYDVDPNLEYKDVPEERTLICPRGSSDPLVEMTIIQSKKLLDSVFPDKGEDYKSLMKICFDILGSLVSLDNIVKNLKEQIDEKTKIINGDFKTYTKGRCPKELPIIEDYEAQFRSFVGGVNKTFKIIFRLFCFADKEHFSKRGLLYTKKFDKALEWAKKNKGEKSYLTILLSKYQPMIELWIKLRNVLEHPKPGSKVELLNFSLLPDRSLRVPTWKLIYSKYPNMAKPQALIKTFEICINNLLGMYKELLLGIVSLDKTFIEVKEGKMYQKTIKGIEEL